MKPAFFAVFLCIVNAHAAFTPADWEFSKELLQGSGARGGDYGLVALDSETYAGTQDTLADLRLIASDGREVPYALFKADAREYTVPVSAQMTDLGTTGRTTSFKLELQEGSRHNQLDFKIKTENFRASARIESLEHGNTWKTIRDGAVLFSVAAGYRASHLSVEYPVSTAGHLRVTLTSDKSPVEVVSMSTCRKEIVPAREELRPARVETTIRENKSDILQLDLGQNGQPVSRLKFTVRDANFQRSVIIYVPSDDKSGWRKAGEGVIWRFNTGSYHGEQLAVSFPEARTRKLRIEVCNGDNPGLERPTINLYGIRQELLFPGQGDAFRLYFGNPYVRKPDYDFIAQSPHINQAVAGHWTLGPRCDNADFVPQDRRPWSERHPGLFWGVLLLACVAMGWLIARQARAVSNGDSGKNAE
ncbi:MAG: DUF3999 family protein [Elusimicrobia bacterium]|nr:DUF3999 family protein [Elusimicrobiota bacterium]